MILVGVVLFYISELLFLDYTKLVELFCLNLWESFWIEFFLIQLFITYQIYQIFISKNFFATIINLLYFLVLIGIYLSLMQFEMFACFLFISEFVILVFFYALFLHLNYSNKNNMWIFSNNNSGVLFLFGFLLLFLLKSDSFFLMFNINELYLLFLDLYKLYDNTIMNDLIYFFYFFYYYHTFLFLIIGGMLLFMTVVLLYATWLYTSLKVKKQTLNIFTSSVKITKFIWKVTLDWWI